MADRYYLQGARKSLPAFDSTRFLFDANVWLSISGPFPDQLPARASAYSGFYKTVLAQGGTVVLPNVILGEFVNRAVDIQARLGGFQKGRGVKIHQADNYGEWIREACDLSYHIASDNERVADAFDTLDLDACFTRVEAGGIEFHDVVIAELCRRDGYLLVTDDADYSDQDIDIVTWNTRLT